MSTDPFDRLPARVRRVLRDLGCETVDDLMGTMVQSFRGVRGIGEDSQMEIARFAAKAAGVEFEGCRLRRILRSDTTFAHAIDEEMAFDDGRMQARVIRAIFVPEPRCDACRFMGTRWTSGLGGENASAESTEECRLRPPTINGWPKVDASDWCGQYEKRP